MSSVKCEFTSVWDDGSVVTTDCQYDIDTGLCEPEVSKSEPPTGCLEREYITLEDGEEIEVCQECHEYVLKPIVGDLSDCSFGETTECRNSDCPSREEANACNRCGKIDEEGNVCSECGEYICDECTDYKYMKKIDTESPICKGCSK